MRWYFNSQPREGGWLWYMIRFAASLDFNSQPREGGWQRHEITVDDLVAISTHSRAKAAGFEPKVLAFAKNISTHSRAKAAGIKIINTLKAISDFNSQPREGGWLAHVIFLYLVKLKFQLTAARRRLV